MGSSLKVRTILSLFTDVSPVPRTVPGTLPVVYHYIFLNSVCVCAQSLSCFQLFVILWTVACQVHLSMEFSRQEYWNGLPVPPPVDLCGPGMEPTFPVAPALAGRLFTAEPPGKPKLSIQLPYNL